MYCASHELEGVQLWNKCPHSSSSSEDTECPLKTRQSPWMYDGRLGHKHALTYIRGATLTLLFHKTCPQVHMSKRDKA